MLLYPLPALLTPFPRTFVIKGNVNNGRILPSYPFPDIVFTNEEATGCINEEAMIAVNEAVVGAITCFLFHVLLFQSHQQLIDLIFLVPLQF